MKNIKKHLRYTAVSAIVLMFLFTGCNKKTEEGVDIIEVLSFDSNFSIFTGALQNSDASSILKNYSPLTVFAPPNSAFEELFDTLGVNSIEDISSAKLDSILLYHILAGKVTASNLIYGYAGTLCAGPGYRSVIMLINVNDLTLNGDVNITDFDRMASNGVIHIIDKVLLPVTIFDIVRQNGSFTHFVEAVIKAELESTLRGTGPYTLFAPTDDAFDDLFTDLGVTGVAELTKEQLIPILQYHILDGNMISNEFFPGDITTHNGDIKVEFGTSVTLNTTATVIGFDLQGTNGVVHVIDKVLSPPLKK